MITNLLDRFFFLFLFQQNVVTVSPLLLSYSFHTNNGLTGSKEQLDIIVTNISGFFRSALYVAAVLSLLFVTVRMLCCDKSLPSVDLTSGEFSMIGHLPFAFLLLLFFLYASCAVCFICRRPLRLKRVLSNTTLSFLTDSF